MNINPTNNKHSTIPFTVLMSVYKNDKPNLLIKAVESCFLNTVIPNYFVLVIDGLLTEDLTNTVKKLKQKYPIDIVKLEKNVGLANALNIGLKSVKTEWVARADSDDFNIPTRFEIQINKIKQDKSIDILGSSILEVDSNGKEIAIRSTANCHEEIVSFSKKRNPFNHMTVMYKKSKVLESGGYPNIYLKEDYALWATMICKGYRTSNIEEPLVIATAGKDMYRRRGGLKYALAETELQNHLVKLKLKSKRSGFFHGFLRAIIFLLPPKLREIIYLNHLRNNKR